nr:unnamed protein product [Spirometra erinaceieuropaei]
MASPVNLITVLQKTVSTENAELVAAQNFLEEAVKADLPGLLRQLSDILANSQCEPNDLDMVDYLNSLWSSCLEAYTGIVQGLKGDDNQPSPQLQFVATHVPFILSFVQHAGSDPICTEEIISSSCGLIGDLVSAFGAEILPIVDVEPIQNILTQGRRAKSGRTRNVAIWATKEIKKMQNAAKADQLGAHRCNEFVISRATLLTMCL